MEVELRRLLTKLCPGARWFQKTPKLALDFVPLEGKGKGRYIAGIHAAVGHDYAPLAAMFLRVIARTWKRAASSSR